MTAKVKRPLAEVLPIAERLREALRPSCERIEIAGSLRRRKAECGDIELVIIPKFTRITGIEADLFGACHETAEEINDLWAQLDELCPPESRRKWGGKYRQFVYDGVQVDLFTTDHNGWGWIYLVRTGSAYFSNMVAEQLNVHGYTSKEGRIYRRVRGADGRTMEVKGDPIHTPSEEDVFHLARMDYVEPEERA